MGLFKKKDKEEIQKSDVAKADFKIVVLEDVGYSVREVKTFGASRFVDEDKSIFIKSEKNKFMEIYPQDMKDHIHFSKPEIEKKLKTKQEQLKRIRDKKIEEYKENEPNTKDLEHEIQKLQAKLRSFDFEKSASYVSYDSKGQVTFHFIRKGSHMFPMKWDTDTSTVFTPSEAVKKDAGLLIRNKERKYTPKKLVEGSTIVLLIIGILLCVGNIFLGGWVWKQYDTSNMAEVERQSLESANKCGEIVNNYANTMQKILEEQASKPQTVIGGVAVK